MIATNPGQVGTDRLGGMHGRYLRVDLDKATAETHPLPADLLSRLIGGVGLATYLLYRHCPPGADPLGAENPLVLATSPFVGTGITTASKLAVAAKSPQTGFIGDSLSSSYLSIELKRTGFDALVVTGRRDDWGVLILDRDRVSVRPADDLLGLDPLATAGRLRAALGRGYRVAAIGLAGERGVRYAAISNDGRLAGRTGTGAVMGAKRLKAIAVRGTALPPVADPAALSRAARALARRSLGPETAKYRELGTAANLAFFDRLGTLPTRNFREGRFEHAEAIAGETLLVEHGSDRHACAACTIGCEHHYRTRDGGPTVQARLEYEALFALGSLCGIGDPNAVLRAAAACDELGVDAISAGATVAWAMECAERGVRLPGDPPRFGDAAGLLRTIGQIGRREGELGALLAEGSRRAAELVGQGSEGWAMHVKGLEMPGYDPRRLPTIALGLAVGARGACHNRSTAYEVDFSDRLDPNADALTRARAAAAAEDQAAVLDSLTICKFLRHCFDDLFGEAAALHEMVTGVRIDLRQAGARIVDLKKRFNVREGWTRADDRLPDRLFDPARLDELVGAYYQVRGWRPDGTVGAEVLLDIL
ncbi:MAG TPA: aldehyde ferredoxin oxidoreductase family protein [Chloroflexota bacterium]|jgi:aldehyde:ferredoxin oxidoreductase|nr:aldehyde ferredoxin oxidoreductase family protein [Chloroflexota bacterium]